MNGNGYNGFSKSNNAVWAEEDGEFPASVCAKKLGIPIAAIRKSPCQSGWHHTSSHYNRTPYYSLAELQAWASTPEGKAIILEANFAEKVAEHTPMQFYHNCTVKWREWVGSRNYGSWSYREYTGCRVEVNKNTAKVFHSNGTRLTTKRLTTNGFSFEEVKK